jgi:hypothetical protein
MYHSGFEVWWAVGGWDDGLQEPVAGGALLERCDTPEEALEACRVWPEAAARRHGPGECVVIDAAVPGQRVELGELYAAVA